MNKEQALKLCDESDKLVTTQRSKNHKLKIKEFNERLKDIDRRMEIVL